MSFLSVLFHPAALLLPAAVLTLSGPVAGPEQASSIGQVREDRAEPDAPLWPAPMAFVPGRSDHLSPLMVHFEPQPAGQVRIERRMTIRITPRAAARVPDAIVEMPRGGVGGKFVERKIGDCLPVAGIAGVQPDRSNRLLLFMRDRRLVSAELERSCRARDFYSGFYLSRSSDGRLCVDRDTLLSRSGMNCKLTRIRQLVEVDR